MSKHFSLVLGKFSIKVWHRGLLYTLELAGNEGKH